MNITRENYEAYFIDYIDGVLTDSQIHEMEAFLMSNDDLREELEGLEKITLDADNTEFQLKENLKNIDLTESVNESNFDFYCIADMEGDLTEVQSQKLHEYISKNPLKLHEKQSFSLTRLPKSEKVVYQNKPSLKHSIFQINSPVVYRTLALAASLAILFVLYFSFMRKEFDQVFVAEETSKTEKADSTSSKTFPQNNQENILKNKAEERLKSTTRKIKSRASAITIKVGIPIASVTDGLESEKSIEIDSENLLVEINTNNINTSIITDSKILLGPPKERIEFKKKRSYPVKAMVSPAEFLTLQEFAKQKYTDILFSGRDEKQGFWDIASLGVNKVGDITGTKMSLSTALNEQGESKKLSFNSRLLSFSTPINRAD